MTTYLVTLGTTLDDLPVRVHGSLNEAQQNCASIAASDPIEDHADIRNAYNVAGRDECSVVGLQIWEFDAFGRVVARHNHDFA